MQRKGPNAQEVGGPGGQRLSGPGAGGRGLVGGAPSTLGSLVVTLTHKACLWARVSCPLEAPGYTLGRFFLIPWGEDFTRPGIPPPRPLVPNPCCVPWSPTHAVSLSLPQYACGVEAEVVGKPSPEFFKSALQEMGVEAHEVSQLPPKCVPRGSCRGRPACSPGAAWVPEMSLGAQAPPGTLPGSQAGIPLPPPSPGMRADLTGVSGKDSKGGPLNVLNLWNQCLCKDLVLELGGSPREGNGNPLQYSCLRNPRDREAWWATVHRVAKSQTGLRD